MRWVINLISRTKLVVITLKVLESAIFQLKLASLQPSVWAMKLVLLQDSDTYYEWDRIKVFSFSTNSGSSDAIEYSIGTFSYILNGKSVLLLLT